MEDEVARLERVGAIALRCLEDLVFMGLPSLAIVKPLPPLGW
jgi:hypothetical protein